MCNTCNTTNTTNSGCNCGCNNCGCNNGLLSWLFGNNHSCGCGNWSNSVWGQNGCQRICRDCCGNLRITQFSNGCGCNNGCSCNNGCGCNSGCGCNNGCGGVQANVFTQSSRSSNDYYYARQYGLNGRSSRCGCLLED